MYENNVKDTKDFYNDIGHISWSVAPRNTIMWEFLN